MPKHSDLHTRIEADNTGTMGEVRHAIDELDRLLVGILKERQDYMDAAARIKGDVTKIRDPERIEDVVSKVKSKAREVGLSESIAEPVWRTLIERCIAYEFKSYDEQCAEENDVKIAS